MIELHPGGSLANPVLTGIIVATVIVSAMVTMRWNWKAWPMTLFAGLTLPFLIPIIVMVVVSRFDGWGSFVFQATKLIFLVGLPSAMAGYFGAIVVRKVRSNGR